MARWLRLTNDVAVAARSGLTSWAIRLVRTQLARVSTSPIRLLGRRRTRHTSPVRSILFAIAAGALTFSLAACGGTNPKSTTAPSPSPTADYASCAVTWQVNHKLTMKQALEPCVGLGGKVQRPKRIDCKGNISDYTTSDGSRTDPPIMVELYDGQYLIAYFDGIQSVELGSEAANDEGLTNKELYESVCLES